jgi:hypothetical protein
MEAAELEQEAPADHNNFAALATLAVTPALPPLREIICAGPVIR